MVRIEPVPGATTNGFKVALSQLIVPDWIAQVTPAVIAIPLVVPMLTVAEVWMLSKVTALTDAVRVELPVPPPPPVAAALQRLPRARPPDRRSRSAGRRAHQPSRTRSGHLRPHHLGPGPRIPHRQP